MFRIQNVICTVPFLSLFLFSLSPCSLFSLLRRLRFVWLLSSSSSSARVSRLLCCCNTLLLPPAPASLVSPLFQILFCCLELADFLQYSFVTIFFSMFFSRLGCASFFFSGRIDTNLYVSTVCAH
jgi:hypothetical protein